MKPVWDLLRSASSSAKRLGQMGIKHPGNRVDEPYRHLPQLHCSILAQCRKINIDMIMYLTLNEAAKPSKIIHYALRV